MKLKCKRIGSLLLALCMVLTMLPVQVAAAVEDTFTDGGLEYEVLTEDGTGGGTVALTGYNFIFGSPTGILTVAESVYKDGITYSVTEIGASAFIYSSGITGVTIPASVESIGEGVFYKCSSLTAFTVADANACFSAEDGVLYDKAKTTLLEYPFGKAFTLSSLPGTVKKIRAYAFAYRDDITGVNIPASLEEIDPDAFYRCENLSAFTVDSANEAFSAEDGVLYDKSGETLLQYPLGKSLASFSFPDTVRTIGAYAFAYRDDITDIVIPDSVETIGEGAFANCRYLASVTIGSSVETVGKGAFYYCENLASVVFEEGSSLKTIGEEAFRECEKLNDLSLPESLESIGAGAFGYCSSLESINIPALVNTIGEQAFYVIPKLAVITVDPDNEYFSAEDDVLYDKTKTLLIRYLPAKEDTSFSIPASVETIGESAFYACDNLEAVTIPGSVDAICESAFFHSDFEEVTFLGAVPPSLISDDIFSNCNYLTAIYVPTGSVAAYKTALTPALDDAGKTIDIIQEYPTVTIDLGTVATVGSGDGWSFNSGYNNILIEKPNQNYILTGAGAEGVMVQVDYTAANAVLTLEDGMSLNARGAVSDTVLIWASNVTVQVKGSAVLNGQCSAICFQNGGTISLADGAVLTANGGPDWAGIYSEGSNSLIITGPGTVNSTGGEGDATLEDIGGAGIYVTADLTVTGGAKVNAAGGSSIDANWGGSGIKFDDSGDTLTIAAGSEVKATAGAPEGCGVESGNDLTVSGVGTLTAEGKGGAYALAAHGDINITGCTITAFNNDNTENICEFEGTLYHTGGTLNGNPPQEPVHNYGVTVSGVRVTGYNKDKIAGKGITGSISYNPDSKTLTLDNAVITSGKGSGNAIESKDDILILLKGNNRLGTIPQDWSKLEHYSIAYGVHADGKSVTVEGVGSLAIYDAEVGILAQNVTVDTSGIIMAKEYGGKMACCLKAEGGVLTINKGTLNLSSYYSNGIYGDSIVINGGTVTAQSVEAFAFNNAPTFGNGYSYKVTAGNDAASAREIPNPVGSTFTAGKYVRIEPKTSGGGDNDNGKDDSGSSGRDRSTAPATAKASVDQSGNASAAVTQTQISNAISKAAEAAAKSGQPARVEINVEAPAEAKSVETTIPQASINELAKGKVESLTITTPAASITFDAKALSAISEQTAGEVKITVSKADTASLSEADSQKIGDRPVFDFSVTGGDKVISQFGGTLTIAVPYTPRPGEDINAIVIYYINSEGKAEAVTGCRYDPATGRVIFETDHFSTYAVGYNKISFKDVEQASPYAEAVTFIAARGITGGTGNGNYSPGAALSRAEFLVMLMRAYDIAPDKDISDNFADAGNTWYTGYLAAAKRLGISEGVGANSFAPKRKITKQELYTLLYNSLKAIGKLPEGDSGKNTGAFSDKEDIASWAEAAVSLFVKAGIIETGEGRLSPKDAATRAEMAQIMYRMLSK